MMQSHKFLVRIIHQLKMTPVMRPTSQNGPCSDAKNAAVIQNAKGVYAPSGRRSKWRVLYRSAIGSDGNWKQFFVDEYRLDFALHVFPKPVVALMDGIVMGGGMGLAQGADIRVVTERTKMAMPETRIGFIPDVGGAFLLSRAPGALGLHAALTGAQ